MATLTQTADKPARSFYLISGLALLWNLMGIATYLMTVTMSPEALAEMTEAERALYSDIPWWATSAYAIAVFGGTLGCVALLLRKAWAVPVLIVSLAAIVVQMGHAFFLSPMLEIQGATAAILPVLILAVAGYLVWYSRKARARGWIR